MIHRIDRYSRSITLIGLVIALGWTFGYSAIGIDQLAFRDVSHFYTPLYDYVAERCRESYLPLWNPLDQTGMPLVGDTTTAVFYPVRWLLYSIPASPDTQISWYCVIHLMGAGIAAYFAAIWCGASRLVSPIAGMIYPLSGSILFLYTNPPFLVSAAWLPLFVAGIFCVRRHPFAKRVAISVMSLSMMILGGDPQTALHAILLCGSVSMCGWGYRRWRIRRHPSSVHSAKSVAEMSPGQLTVIIGLGLAMSMTQFAASLSWSRHSDRMNASDGKTIIARPQYGSPQHTAFDYSIAPWQWISLATPSPLGKIFPEYSRLDAEFAPSHRWWTPSLYAGAFAVLSVIVALRDRVHCIWIVMMLISLLFASGRYGVVWIAQQFTDRLDAWDPAVGGLYWMMYQWLPGYDALRYPAKWLPFLHIAIAILAALTLDRMRHKSFQIPSKILTASIIMLVGALVLTIAVRYLYQPSVSASSDRYWGPLNERHRVSTVIGSLAHSVVVVTALAWIMYRDKTRRRKGLLMLVIGVTMIELLIAAQSHVLTTRRVDCLLASGRSHPIANRWLRTESSHPFPKVWREQSSVHRTLEVQASERITWFGRWHLASRAPVLNGMVSIRSQSMSLFWEELDRLCDTLSLAEQQQLWRKLRQWLAIDGICESKERSEATLVGDKWLVLSDVTHTVDSSLSPPVQLHGTWRVHDDSRLNDRAEMAATLRELQMEDRSPIVYGETDEPTLNSSVDLREMDSRTEMVTMEPDRVVMRITIDRPYLVVRPVYQDGGWQLKLKDRSTDKTIQASIHPIDMLLQGAVVPAGSWELTWEYRPVWVIPSLVCFLGGWLAWIAIAGKGWWRSRASSQRLVFSPPGALKPQSAPDDATTR